jgi:hypothetical protein
MDLPTSRAIRDTIGSLKGQLPAATYEKVAPLLSDLIALLERAHEDERRQLRAERAALDKEREAVNLARHSLGREREALAREREIVEKEKQLAQRWREAEHALDAAASAIEPRPEPS